MLAHVNAGWALNLQARYPTSHLDRSNAVPIERVNRQLILMIQTISKVVQEWRNRHWISEILEVSVAATFLADLIEARLRKESYSITTVIKAGVPQINRINDDAFDYGIMCRRTDVRIVNRRCVVVAIDAVRQHEHRSPVSGFLRRPMLHEIREREIRTAVSARNRLREAQGIGGLRVIRSESLR